MAADFPTERRFWFDPPFHAGQSALMHRQPDNVWRIDLQLGPDADAEAEQQARARDPAAEEDARRAPTSSSNGSRSTRFHCRRLERFVHGRVIFAGDAAHQVSPFGARGGNSRHPGRRESRLEARRGAARARRAQALLDSYDDERMQAADENIGHSTRSTDFIAPHSRAERTLRDAVLALRRRREFARRMVNSGRLSVATVYDTPLSTPDEEPSPASARLGAPVPDAPMPDAATGATASCWNSFGGGSSFSTSRTARRRACRRHQAARSIGEDLIDAHGLFAQRFDADAGRRLSAAARPASVRALAHARSATKVDGGA